MVPEDLRYSEQHEWVRIEGDTGTVGITDHAQNALGDITFVELPSPGTELAQGDEACAIESCKAAASIYAPVSGKIAEANSLLENDPGLVNKDCYSSGWIYKMGLSDQSDVDKLMTSDQYEKFLQEQN
jgi:glycine cleavage system H protein